MCSGTRRTVLQTMLALMLGAPLLASALPPREETSATGTPVVVQPARRLVTPESTLPDAAAMVLAGTVLIGAAAAVRRAA